MKHTFYSIACSAIGLLVFTSSELHAQYTPAFNDKGKSKTVEERKYEYNRDNQNKYTPKPAASPSSSNINKLPKAPVQKPKEKVKDFYDDIQWADDNSLRAIRIKDKWGYVDWDKIRGVAGIALAVKYDSVKFTSNNFFGVKLSGKWGFVGRDGAVKLPFIYDNLLSGFTKENMSTAQVIKKGRIITISTTGKDLSLYYAKYETKGPLADDLAKVSFENKYGFIDKDGIEKIPLVYDTAGDFQEELASVQLNNKWGFIDKNGKIVIALNYEAAGSFSNGESTVKLNGKWGTIAKSGKTVIPIIYDEPFVFLPYTQGAKVKLSNKFGYINRKGDQIIPAMYDKMGEFRNGRIEVELNKELLIFDANGKQIKLSSNYSRIGDFIERRAMVVIITNGIYKFGFINENMKEVIPVIYDGAGNFSEGLASVKKGITYGYIDTDGVEVIPFNIATDFSIDFKDGLALVGSFGKFGFIDKTGKEVIPRKYISASSFSEGLSCVALKNFKNGFIDKNDQVVVPLKYDYAGSFSEGLAWVCKDAKKCGFITPEGKIAIPLKYEQCNGFKDGMASVMLNNKWGFINLKGEQVISTIYEGVNDFNEGMAGVKINGKWGFINRNGDLVISPLYDQVKFFSEGLAAVTAELKWGFIDLKGIETIPLIYKYVGDRFVNGKVYVNQNNQDNFIDRRGEFVSQF